MSERKQFTLHLDVGIIKEAKKNAIDLDMAFSEYFEQALEHYNKGVKND